MTDLVTDTHGLVWYLEDNPKLGSEADKAFDACDRGEIIISVISCEPKICYNQNKAKALGSIKILYHNRRKPCITNAL
jgi:PIN domain nuclease of toxin-antitoxin system